MADVTDNVSKELHCKCGNVWIAEGYNELGAFFYYDEKDAYCSDCKEEGKEI